MFKTLFQTHIQVFFALSNLCKVIYEHIKYFIKYRFHVNGQIPEIVQEEILKSLPHCRISQNNYVGNVLSFRYTVYYFDINGNHIQNGYSGDVKIYRKLRKWVLELPYNTFRYRDYSTSYIFTPIDLIDNLKSIIQDDYDRFKKRNDFQKKWNIVTNTIRNKIDIDSFLMEICDEYGVSIKEYVPVKYVQNPNCYHINYKFDIPSTCLDYSFEIGHFPHGTVTKRYNLCNDENIKIYNNITTIYNRCKIRDIKMIYKISTNELDFVFIVPEEVMGFTYLELFNRNI